MIKLLRSLKYFIQRGLRGYSEDDIYNCNGYLADLIVSCVKTYQKLNNTSEWGGIPYPFHSDDYKGPTWDETLTTMIEKLSVGADYINQREPSYVNDNGIKDMAALKDMFVPSKDHPDMYEMLPIESEEYKRYRYWADRWNKVAKQQWKEGMRMLIKYLPGMWV